MLNSRSIRGKFVRSAAYDDVGCGQVLGWVLSLKHVLRAVGRYDTGTGAAVLRSPEEVQQGEWIKIAGTRQMRDGTLRVNDGNHRVRIRAPGNWS